MKEIELTRGKVALVDDEDYITLSQYKWHAHFDNGNWYATRNMSRGDGTRTRISMHRAITNAPSGAIVDHRDQNGLNNTRENLRLCDRSGNTCNGRIRADNTSGYRGVIWHKASQSWRVQVGPGKSRIHLGPFDTAEVAARAYDAIAKECFGEFAQFNFPGVHEDEVRK